MHNFPFPLIVWSEKITGMPGRRTNPNPHHLGPCHHHLLCPFGSDQHRFGRRLQRRGLTHLSRPLRFLLHCLCAASLAKSNRLHTVSQRDRPTRRRRLQPARQCRQINLGSLESARSSRCPDQFLRLHLSAHHMGFCLLAAHEACHAGDDELQ